MAKLSKNQIKVLKLMQEGWELGSDLSQVGFVGLVERAWLQKNGIGHGAPCEDTKIVTVNSLVRRELIERISNPYRMIRPTLYRLTEKGKEILKNA